MGDELIISCNFPFKECVKCKELTLDTSAMYADNALAVVVISCTNKDICQNAYEVWKGENDTQDSSIN